MGKMACRRVVVGWVVAAAMVVAVGSWRLAQSEGAPGRPSVAERARLFAVWDPARLEGLRRQVGLIGPGTRKPLPDPSFPSYLKPPRSVEDLLPGARAAVRQTGGRSPLGLVESGETVVIVVPYDAEPMVQQAIRRAYQERGVEARILFEHELAGVPREDLDAIRRAENVWTDWPEPEPPVWFFRTIQDLDRARAWVRQQDPELHDAGWPQIRYPDGRLEQLAENYERMVRNGLVRYLDQHPEVDKVFWRSGGRTRTRRMLAHHGDKFTGNYTYTTYYDLVSRVPSFPPDVWRLIELKTVEPLGYVDRAEAYDPEGTALWFELAEEEAQLWARGVYQQGHLYMMPSQATGRYPYSVIDYPSFESQYVPRIQVRANGVIAGTNDHVSTHPRLEFHFQDGKLVRVEGGGLYGEFMRLLLNYPGTQNLTWPFFDRPGYWWLFEAGLGTNPKYYKHPRELLEGRNSSERNVGGAIHWSVGAEVYHGPDAVGQRPKEIEEFGRRYNVPIEHCCHNHTLLTTYQARIRGTNQWVTLIEHGRLTALDDPLVRALASRYGDPDEVLGQDYIPALPGINAPGNYNEYARDPQSYWIRWSRSIEDGTYPYFRP